MERDFGNFKNIPWSNITVDDTLSVVSVVKIFVLKRKTLKIKLFFLHA